MLNFLYKNISKYPRNSMNCKVFYRISSKGLPKIKLPGANKIRCLNNFINVFGKEDITIIADNCSPELLMDIYNLGLNTVETNLGNAASFWYCYNLAINLPDDETVVYFVEDDYLHLPNAKQLLLEGIQESEYISLYDHPDKYGPIYNGGEIAKVFKTSSTHWRHSVSTCMTFAAKVKTLKNDSYIWKTYTDTEIPEDHRAFCHLNKAGHKLSVCIPGVGCHVDLSYSILVGENTMEPWAIQLLLKEVEQSIYKTWNGDAIEAMEKIIHFQKHEPLELLALTAQIEEYLNKKSKHLNACFS